MLRKKLMIGTVSLLAAQMVALACYVAVSSGRSCPNTNKRGSLTCTLDQATTYSWVTTSTTGWTDAKSDGTYHCRYLCPNGSYFWAYPGAVTTGANTCGG